MKHLVLDGQVFQTPAFYRGMGKYSTEFIREIVRSNKKKARFASITVVLSAELTKNGHVKQEEIRAALPGDIIIEQLSLARNEIAPDNIIALNRKIIDDFINSRPDFVRDGVDFLILSPMQGELSSVFPTSPSVRNLVLCYDLIPLMFWKIYLQNPITITEYLTKLRELYRADGYVCISKTCANDLALYLGIDPERIVSVNGGAINHSTNEEEVYKTDKPFVLMPTGNDLRKNNRNAILAFDEYNRKAGGKYQLLVTSFFKDHEIENYRQLCPDVVFTGNVSGGQLSYLYQHASALLFVPHYEGLGLPLLEAMENNCPIVCSDISVFREMTREGVVRCDQNSIQDIARALGEVLSRDYRPSRDIYSEVLKSYSWARTVSDYLKWLEAMPDDTNNYNRTVKETLGVFGLSPSVDSHDGSLLMAYVHATMARKYHIGYYLSGDTAVSFETSPRMNTISYISEPLVDAQTTDRTMFYMEDHVDSAGVMLHALVKTGTVVLFDASLNSVWECLKSSGVIGDERYDAERALATKLGLESKGLVSLVAKGHRFIVFSSEVKAELENIAQKLGLEIDATLTAYPSISLPYAEILPEKSDGAITKHGEDDYHYFDFVSRITSLRFDPNHQFKLMLARSLGATVDTMPDSTSMAEFTDLIKEKL